MLQSQDLVRPESVSGPLTNNVYSSTLCIGHIFPGFPVYQAASPDEETLVGFARELGWVFLSRTRDFIVVSELGATRQYQLLALLDFTSKRRRMSVLGKSTHRACSDLRAVDLLTHFGLKRPCFSFLLVIVREPEGGLKLYCKGADVVILERLQKNCPHQESTEMALEVKQFCY